MHPKTRIHADESPEVDHFDRLPDTLVLLILNEVSDIGSLGRCCAVSRRFNSLVPFVHDVYIKIDRVLTIEDDSENAVNPVTPKPRNIISHVLKMMFFAFIKPFHTIRCPTRGSQSLLPQLCQHSPAEVLKNFTHVQSLSIEFPSGDVGTEEGMLLKWRAEFGGTLQKCVILGGTLVEKKPVSFDQEAAMEDNGCMPESFYTNGGLKLRVIWTISSLIAASTRHFLLHSVVKDHPTLTSIILSDADGQGVLSMGIEQLKEFRENIMPASASSNRTPVPACNMKLKYAPYLELPGGMLMQGATLVVIKPSCEENCIDCSNRKENEAFISRSFEGPFKVAVKALMKRRTYLLEMNGF